MLVPRPQRHDECVAFLPCKFFAVDHRGAAAAKRVINCRAGVAMRLGFFAGPEHLHSARHRRQGGAAGCRIDKLERRAIETLTRKAGEPLQSWVGVAPMIMQELW